MSELWVLSQMVALRQVSSANQRYRRRSRGEPSWRHIAPKELRDKPHLGRLLWLADQDMVWGRRGGWLRALRHCQAHTSFFRTPGNPFFLLHHLNASDCDRTAYYRTISRKALNDRSCTPYQRQGPIQFPLECRLEIPTVKVRTIWCATSSLKNPTFSCLESCYNMPRHSWPVLGSFRAAARGLGLRNNLCMLQLACKIVLRRLI